MGHSLDLRTLRAFVVVAREGHVTRAAQQLHLSQPAISLQLKRLSVQTGISLFRRRADGIELTREGVLLAAKAEQVLAATMDFDQTAKNILGRVGGKLRIGTIVDPEFTRLGGFLKILLDNGLDLETELRHGMSGEIPVALRRDELDVGFFLGDTAELVTGSGAEIVARDLARLSYRVVAPPSFAALVSGRDWADLAALPWIGTPAASVHHRLLAPLFVGRAARQNVVALVDQETSMLAMVRAGVGLSLCRESLALEQQQTQGLVIADRVRLDTTLSFIALAARRLDPTLALAFEAIDRCWRLS